MDQETLNLEAISRSEKQLTNDGHTGNGRASSGSDGDRCNGEPPCCLSRLPNELKLKIVEELVVAKFPIRVCEGLRLFASWSRYKFKSPSQIDALGTLLVMLPHHKDPNFEQTLLSAKFQHSGLFHKVGQAFEEEDEWELRVKGGTDVPRLALCLRHYLTLIKPFETDMRTYFDNKIQLFRIRELSAASIQTFYEKNQFDFPSGFVPCIAWVNMIGTNAGFLRRISIQVPMLELFLPEAHDFLATQARRVELCFERGEAKTGFRAGLSCHDNIREQPLGAVAAFRHRLENGALRNLKELRLLASPPLLDEEWNGIQLQFPNLRQPAPSNLSSPLFEELKLIAGREDLRVSLEFWVYIRKSWPDDPGSDTRLMLHFQKPIRQMAEEFNCEVKVVCYSPWLEVDSIWELGDFYEVIGGTR